MRANACDLTANNYKSYGLSTINNGSWQFVLKYSELYNKMIMLAQDLFKFFRVRDKKLTPAILSFQLMTLELPTLETQGWYAPIIHIEPGIFVNMKKIY